MLACRAVSEQPEKPSQRKKKAWTFLRMVRWSIYSSFMALVLFLGVCVIVGIAGNLTERYPELELPSERPASGEQFSTQQLSDCREALLRMYGEDLEHTQAAFTSGEERHTFLREYKVWGREWRKQFEKLGVSCRFTEFHYEGNSTLGSMAEIYRRLDDLHKYHQRLTRRYMTENARVQREIRELFEMTGREIDLALKETGD